MQILMKNTLTLTKIIEGSVIFISALTSAVRKWMRRTHRHNDAPHSWRSASIGSSRAARLAGT